MTEGEEIFAWYSATNGRSLKQGDLLRDCPVFDLPADLSLERMTEVDVEWRTVDAVVMSQTCDLENNKIKYVMLCATWLLSEFRESNASLDVNAIRKGDMPAFHMLQACDVAGVESEIRIVDFRQVFSLPLPYAAQIAENLGQRARLLPPYREHLSQAFARFFMRVGLPIIIGNIEKPKKK